MRPRYSPWPHRSLQGWSLGPVGSAAHPLLGPLHLVAQGLDRAHRGFLEGLALTLGEKVIARDRELDLHHLVLPVLAIMFQAKEDLSR